MRMKPLAKNDQAAEEAIRLFESHVDFAKAQVRMRERMEAAARDAPADARCHGTKARLEQVLYRFDIRAETFFELVSDIRTQNAFMAMLKNLERFAYEEYTGYPPEILQPTSAELLAACEMIHAKVQRWIYEGYKRLDSPSQTQPEPKREPVTNEDEVLAPRPGTDPNHSYDGSGRRAAVDEYIEEVFSKTKKRITRKDIWTAARYKSRTEFERWERNDQKNPNQSAHERFTKILKEKPHLK